MNLDDIILSSNNFTIKANSTVDLEISTAPTIIPQENAQMISGH